LEEIEALNGEKGWLENLAHADATPDWANVDYEIILNWHYDKAAGKEVNENVPWAGVKLEEILRWHYLHDTLQDTGGLPWADYWQERALKWYYNKINENDTPSWTFSSPEALEWFYKIINNPATNKDEAPPKIEAATALATTSINWCYLLQAGAVPQGSADHPFTTWNATTHTGAFIWWYEYNQAGHEGEEPPSISEMANSE
jgi:hypothetical protein